MSRVLLATGAAVGTGGLAFILYGWLFGDYRAPKENHPDAGSDASAPLGKTGYKLVDALLPKLQAIATSAGIPLGLLVAWIAKESGGKLTSTTKLDERGYFQLMPDESKSLGLDHQRLSTDSDYSLDAGVKLIRKYQAVVNDLNVSAAPAGSSLYWLLVKLAHTVGTGQTQKWVKAATAAGAMGSWSDFESFVLGQHWLGPQPKKWLPFLDSIYRLGKPFGFGSEQAPLVVGFYDPAGASPPFDDPRFKNPSARCVYCVDGYHEMCDAKDRLGACTCACNESPHGLSGLDYLGVSS